MRHRLPVRFRLHAAAAVALVVLGVPGVAAAADRVKVVTPTAIIRAEPSATSKAVAVVAAGTVLDVLVRESGWYRVSVPAGTNRAARPGYIEANAVEATTERAVLVPVGPPTAGARAAAVPQARGGTRVRVFGEGVFQYFAAKESFDAIFGSPTGPFFGGGVDFSVGRLFTAFEVSHFRKTGERAFSFNGESFPLGIEDRISITPLMVNVGYRMGSARSRLVPYVGGGGGAVLYRETSEGSAADEDVKKTAGAFQVFGGVEMRLARSLAFAVEGQYQSVRGVLGTAGISQVLNEKDLGGASVKVKLLFGR